LGDLIEVITNYLNKEQKTAKDVILLAVIGSLVFAVMAFVFRIIGRLIYHNYKKGHNVLKLYFRLFIKQELNLNEYLDVQERIEKGGKLKWYEKKSYYLFHAEEEKMKEKAISLDSLVGRSSTDKFIKEMNNWDYYKKQD
jgi:hypothetical protein